MGCKISLQKFKAVDKGVEFSNETYSETDYECLKMGWKIQKILGEKNKQLKSYFKI